MKTVSEILDEMEALADEVISPDLRGTVYETAVVKNRKELVPRLVAGLRLSLGELNLHARERVCEQLLKLLEGK